MEKFKKDVKAKIIADNVFCFSLLLCILCLAFAILFLVNKLYQLFFIHLLAFALFCGISLLIKKLFHSKIEKRYEFQLDDYISFNDIKKRIEALNPKSYSNSDDCVVYSFKEKRKEYRILLYTTDNFNKKAYSNKRKSFNNGFNKKYNCKSVDSKYTLAKKLYINIVFVNESSKELESMLATTADKFVHRASPLLNGVAVVGNKLYIPYYVGYYSSGTSIYRKLSKKVFELFNIKMNNK